MNSRIRIHSFNTGLALVTALLFSATTIWANGFRNPPPGAAALAKDGGKVAFIDDASAVTHNPANLTSLEAPESFGTVTFIYSWSEYDAPGGGPSAETQNDWHAIPAYFAAVPFDDGQWAVGLGVSSPFGQSTEWSKDTSFKGFAPYFAELLTLDINPSIAARFSDAFSLGAGVQVMYSEIDLRQVIPWSGVLMAPVPDGSLHTEGDGVGVGGNIGATFKFLERHRIAVVYRLPIDVEYNGTTKITAIPAPAAGSVVPRSDFDTEIDFPGILAFGYGIQLTDALQLGVDVEWVEFSRFESLPVDLGANNASGLAPPLVPQNWNDVWTVGFGADWQYSENWALRGGYKYLESPIPDRTHAPTLPDADRHLITLGLGFEQGAHTVDLAYALSIFENRDVSSSPVPAFNGDYDLTSHLFSLAYNYKF